MHNDILINVNNGVGIITLNRPETLNALTLAMVQKIHAALRVWNVSPEIKAVILKSTGKAFCAGGDIVAIQQARLAGDERAIEMFFSKEYDMNHTIQTYSKPYVSLIDGYCMGGGMGLSVHGAYRVVTENTIMAMPEASIGFFPDVGGSYFLPRLPGRIGMYLGLTGAKISAADAIYCGLATHYVPSDRLQTLEKAIIAEPDNVKCLLNHFTRPVNDSQLKAKRDMIDLYFAADVPDENVALMKAQPSVAANEFLEALQQVSPHAVRQTAELIVAGASSNLKTCLARELEATHQATRHPDFIEGIRAMLIEKDRTPVWDAPSLAA